MSVSTALLQELLELPAGERAALADALLASLDETTDRVPDEVVALAWEAEIRRRVERLDAGEADVIPGDVVLARLRATADGG
ncbi:MAG: addiction module protein [Myxococcales bacterium]|nr:addiction module protein [Myxococcales bacterium]